MKKQCLAACFAAFFSCATYAQDSLSVVDTTIYTPTGFPVAPSGSVVDHAMPEGSEIPSFPGGDPALFKFLASNMQYPDAAKKNNIQGVVALTFVVEKDGSVSNVTILRDIGRGCGAEAARVVEMMPRWSPGVVDGAAVRVRYTLPVRFKLDAPEKPKKKKLSQRDSLFGN